MCFLCKQPCEITSYHYKVVIIVSTVVECRMCFVAERKIICVSHMTAFQCSERDLGRKGL